MEYAKIKIPFSNTRIFPSGERGFYEAQPIPKDRPDIVNIDIHHVFSKEFRDWLNDTCGPATLGLYRKERYYEKRGKQISRNVAKVSSLSKPAIGLEFEFANKRHALLFKLTWGGS